MVENEGLLFEFIDDLPVGIARADMTGKRPNHYNNFFNMMFGWDASEIDTLENWYLQAYPDEAYRNRLVEEWTQLIEETEAEQQPYSRPMEARVRCKNGDYKWCEVRYYRKGNFIYGIFFDISARKQAQGKLEKLSLVDPLTSVYNRRYFNLEFYDRWNLSKRSKTPLSVILCDVDDFKKINDTHGHLVGDKVLASIAEAIVKTLKRSSDFVARYGGEEFVIVLYGCDGTAALQICQLIKASVESACIPDLGAGYRCSMSYGISTTVADSEMSPEAFLNQADQALYTAKKSGKDRIVVYEQR